jgi:hypothetical protein
MTTLDQHSIQYNYIDIFGEKTFFFKDIVLLKTYPISVTKLNETSQSEASVFALFLWLGLS